MKHEHSAAPLRMCVACREMKTKDALIKVTKSKSGQFWIEGSSPAWERCVTETSQCDVSGKSPTVEGRSAYVCKNAECLKKCRKTRGFNRAFKSAVPEDIYRMTEEIFERNG